MLVVVSAGGCLLVEPVHLELAPLKFLNDFALVVDVPVLSRVLFEVD